MLEYGRQKSDLMTEHVPPVRGAHQVSSGDNVLLCEPLFIKQCEPLGICGQWGPLFCLNFLCILEQDRCCELFWAKSCHLVTWGEDNKYLGCWAVSCTCSCLIIQLPPPSPLPPPLPPFPPNKPPSSCTCSCLITALATASLSHSTKPYPMDSSCPSVPLRRATRALCNAPPAAETTCVPTKTGRTG